MISPISPLPEASAAESPPVSADRHAGLSPTTSNLLAQAEQCLLAGDLQQAGSALSGVEALAPKHPEVQRLRVALLNRTGRGAEAQALL